MALIKCPECGKEISDKAKTCPNCGSPVLAEQPKENNVNSSSSSKPKKNSKLGVVALVLSILGCSFVIGVILAIIDLCQKDGKKKTCSIIALVISGLWLVIGVANSVGNSNKSNTPTTVAVSAQDNKSKEETTKATEAETEIEYISVTADELSDALSSNAMKAQNDYKEKYLEISGKLGNIDSNGKYIAIDSNKDFDFTNIQCYIKSDEQKQIIMEMSRGDSIVIKGYCKDMGELLGYQIDIDEVTAP